MNLIKTVIIEDEQSAVNALKGYINKYCPQLEIIGIAMNAKEGIELLHNLKPQLAFLDVEMPFGNAFDVIDACSDLSFETIFVTAYAEYALKALNQSAAYYLLKPVNIEELILAVNKVQQTINNKEWINRKEILSANAKENKPEMQRIILPLVDGFEVVQLADIIRLKGNGNFTDIYLKDGTKKMVCRFLKHFEDLLHEPFIRIHKSHIVNANFITRYHKGKGGYITLMDESEIEVSATYKDALLEFLGN